MEKLSDAFVFVSHSNADIIAVRQLRNAIEERKAHPILFFLKAEHPPQHLRQLIFAEIGARHHFLLCDSEAARASRWVREEVDYVNSLPRKNIVTVALTADWGHQLCKIEKMLSFTTVFVSASLHDRMRIEPIVERLRDADFEVWFDDMSFGTSWARDTETKLRDAAEEGCFIQFFTRASVFSHWTEMEALTFIKHAKGKKGRFIPVLLDPVQAQLPPMLQQSRHLDFVGMDAHEAAARLLDIIFANPRRS